MVLSYWEWSWAIFLFLSSLCCRTASRLRSFGRVDSICFSSALYCRVWMRTVSWNCFRIWFSFTWTRKEGSRALTPQPSAVIHFVHTEDGGWRQLTLSDFGCCLSSIRCFFCSSLAVRLLYSSWLVHSVACWLSRCSNLHVRRSHDHHMTLHTGHMTIA